MQTTNETAGALEALRSGDFMRDYQDWERRSQPERDLTKIISNALGELPSRHRQFISNALQLMSAADYDGVNSYAIKTK